MTFDTVETYKDGKLVETRQVPVPPEEQNRRSIRSRIEQHIATAEANAGTQAAWNALTAVQKDAALRRTVLVTAKLCRYLLDRNEADPGT